MPIPQRTSSKPQETKPEGTPQPYNSNFHGPQQADPNVEEMQKALLQFYSDAALLLEKNQAALDLLADATKFKQIIQNIKIIGSAKSLDQVDGLWGKRTSDAIFSVAVALNLILQAAKNHNIKLSNQENNFANLLNFDSKSPDKTKSKELATEIKNATTLLTEFNQKSGEAAKTYQGKKLKAPQTDYIDPRIEAGILEKIQNDGVTTWLNKGVVESLQQQGYAFADKLQHLRFQMLGDPTAFKKYLTDQQATFNNQELVQNSQAIDYLLAVLQNNIMGGN